MTVQRQHTDSFVRFSKFCLPCDVEDPLKLLAQYMLFFHTSCWLHVDNYFIWSFIGPVTFIILVSRLYFPFIFSLLLQQCYWKRVICFIVNLLMHSKIINTCSLWDKIPYFKFVLLLISTFPENPLSSKK